MIGIDLNEVRASGRCHDPLGVRWYQRVGEGVDVGAAARCRKSAAPLLAENGDALRPLRPLGGNLPASPAFTVEGTVDREVALGTGAKRVGGWRKWTIYVITLGVVTLGLVASFWRAIVGAL